MNKYQAFLLSLSIILPTIAGVVRYRSIPASYRPLIYILLLGLATELTCYLFFYHTSNALPVNIYILFEFLLFTWQFRSWKNILQHKGLFISLITALSSLWVFNNIIMGRINTFNLTFQVVYSLALVLLAVNQLNWLVVNERGLIFRNAKFIVCMAIIVFFSYKAMTEIFYYYAPHNTIKSNIYVIESYLNVAYNIMLTIAIICIPPKNNFIQLS
jgi:hypothetical protein